jgi:hypothetical protein
MAARWDGQGVAASENGETTTGTIVSKIRDENFGPQSREPKLFPARALMELQPGGNEVRYSEPLRPSAAYRCMEN